MEVLCNHSVKSLVIGHLSHDCRYCVPLLRVLSMEDAHGAVSTFTANYLISVRDSYGIAAARFYALEYLGSDCDGLDQSLMPDILGKLMNRILIECFARVHR